MTTEVDKTIEVDVPVTTAYNQWTQFESFPQFMGGVTEVRQLSDTRLHWVAEIAGVKREWEAEITDQVPDTRIAWRATEGATNAGAVSFSSVSATTTLVTLHLEYEPEGLLEKAGDKLNIVGKQAEGDLDRFKKFIEKQGAEEGGWRGSVAGSPATPGVEDAASSLGDDGKAGVSGKAVAAGVAAVVGAAAAGLAAKKAGSDDSEDDDTVTAVPVTTTSVETETVATTPSSAEPVLATDPLDGLTDTPVPGPFTVEPGIGTDPDRV
jgi:uncharacterized protein YndB with AHSA1/START domain